MYEFIELIQIFHLLQPTNWNNLSYENLLKFGSLQGKAKNPVSNGRTSNFQICILLYDSLLESQCDRNFSLLQLLEQITQHLTVEIAGFCDSLK